MNTLFNNYIAKNSFFSSLAIVFIFSLTIASLKSNAQVKPITEVASAGLLQVQGGIQFPAGNIAKTYGQSNSIGCSVAFKNRSNIIIGLDFNYLFGNSIGSQPFLSNLTTSSGQIVGTDGLPADVALLFRGYSLFAKVGKVFSFSEKNPNSGILISAGLGFLQHKLRIEDQGDSVPQIQGEYSAGYDRLTAGTALNQFVGYLHLDRKRLLNFFVGFEMTQGFTKRLRDFSFDEGFVDQGINTDLFFGIKAGWIIPFYGQTSGKKYYYN